MTIASEILFLSRERKKVKLRQRVSKKKVRDLKSNRHHERRGSPVDQKEIRAKW